MPGGMPRFHVRVLRVQLPVLVHPDLPLIDNSCNLEPGCLLSTGVRVTHAPRVACHATEKRREACFENLGVEPC